MEQEHLGELRDACEAPKPALVGGSDEAVPQREALGLAPQRRDFDGVAAVAPGIPLQQPRLIQAVRELQAIERAAGLLLLKPILLRGAIGAPFSIRLAHSSCQVADATA